MTEHHRDEHETPATGTGRDDADRQQEEESSGSADQRSTDTFEGVRTDEDDVSGTTPS